MARRTNKTTDTTTDSTVNESADNTAMEQSMSLTHNRAQQASFSTTSGIPAFLAGRVQNLSDTGLDASKLYTMEETANRPVYITGFEEQEGDNGVWHIWTAYVPGLTPDDETEVKIAGGGQGLLPVVVKFFVSNPNGVLGIAWNKTITRTGRSFWQALDPRELFTVSPTVTDVTPGDVPF